MVNYRWFTSKELTLPSLLPHGSLKQALLFFFGGRMKREADYQAGLIDRIQELLPKCMILKNDSNYKQGIPDLSIFYGSRWAWLEVKKSMLESHQPNQDYYVGYGNAFSFASFIYPENESVVLKQLYDFMTK